MKFFPILYRTRSKPARNGSKSRRFKIFFSAVWDRPDVCRVAADDEPEGRERQNGRWSGPWVTTPGGREEGGKGNIVGDQKCRRLAG